MVLHEQFGVDHAEISRRLIRGEDSVLADEERSILGKHASVPEALEAMSISPKDVAGLLDGQHTLRQSSRALEKHGPQAHFNTKRYLSQIVSGTVDADQLDYLVRDAHYTGVAYGVIDIDRLVETFDIYNGDLVIDRSGLSAVEGMLVARALMFSSVYYHKTVRIPELMLAKAVERLGKDSIDHIHRMTDAGLLAYLESQGGYSREIATCLKYRKLYKRAYAIAVTDVCEDDWSKIDALGNVERRRTAEEDIARRAGIPSGKVIMDVPSAELPISEPRMSLMDVRILDGKRVRLLPRMSSIASSLQFRRAHDWAIMVACPEKDKMKVAKAAQKVLGL